jgi:hypothetical protein
MKKPTLLMMPGHGWSGTSPLYYTLAHNHNYCHGGHYKENKYLEHIYHYNKGHEELLNQKRFRFRQLFNGLKRDQEDGPKAMTFGERDRPPTVLHTGGPNAHWDPEFVNDFFSLPHNFEKYITYYKKHYEAIKDTYSAVSDFTVSNMYKTESFINVTARYLKPHFNVKVLMIYRDPVQRLWSNIQFTWFQKNRHRGCVDPYHMFWRKIAHHYDDPKEKDYDLNVIEAYTEGYRRYSNAFGKENVHNIVMEELWSEDKDIAQKSKRGLSDFLEYEVTDLFANCFVPEQGSKAPHVEHLSDQFMSNQVDLSEEQLNTARALMDRAYLRFEEMYGYIPKTWTELKSVEVPDLTNPNDYDIEEVLRRDPLSGPQKLSDYR